MVVCCGKPTPQGGTLLRRPHCARRRDKVNWSEGPREGPLGGSERNRRAAAALSAEMAAKLLH